MEFKSKKRDHCFKITIKSKNKIYIIDAQTGIINKKYNSNYFLKNLK